MQLAVTKGTPAMVIDSTDVLVTRGPVIPVIVLEQLDHALPLARALVAGGITVLEVTLRTPVALQAIEVIARALPQALVGAGTIRTPADARAARDAGAAFGVSPGYRREVSAACRDARLPLLPGVATASEAMAALADGYTFVKFFPAQAAGGAAMLKALHGPFPELRFCPTGGVTPAIARELLALPYVPVCGGSWLTPADAMAGGDWGRITELARETRSLRPA